MAKSVRVYRYIFENDEIYLSVDCLSESVIDYVQTYLQLVEYNSLEAEIVPAEKNKHIVTLKHNKALPIDSYKLIDLEKGCSLIEYGNTLSGMPLGAIRGVRSLIYRWLAEIGFVAIHASSVDKDGRAIVFMGDKYAGKTTLMFSCLFSKKFNYVANDTVHLRSENSEIKAVAIPCSLGVRPNTANLFDLKGVLSIAQEMDRHYNFAEKQFVTEKDLLTAIQCRAVRSSRVDLFIFPEYLDSQRDIEVVAVSLREVDDMLRRNTLDFGHWDGGNFKPTCSGSSFVISEGMALPKGYIVRYSLKCISDISRIVSNLLESEHE